MNGNNKPWIIILSGPNGAGKTTFRNTFLVNNPFFSDALFANQDIEYANIISRPENAAQFESTTQNINRANYNIRRKLIGKFKKTMDAVGGNLHERITRKTDENKSYWLQQYSYSIHIPKEYEYVLSNLYSARDLMYRIGGKSVHERINAKSDKYNWYTLYKQIINTIEVQYAINVMPLIRQFESLEKKFQMDAGTNILRRIDKAFESGKNFIFETTGAGNTAQNLIRKAKQVYGYRIYSFHPYVLHPELSIARVQQRVQNGGHDVPTNIIVQRYNKSLNNLPKILKTVDIGIVMDNSWKKPYVPVFMICNGAIYNFSECPQYLQPIWKTMNNTYPTQSVQELLHLQQDIDIAKLTEEQRENLAQIIISTLFGQIR